MFCPQCGKEHSSNVTFCVSCSANVLAQGMSFPAVAKTGAPSEPMTFGKSIATCLAKYVYFKDRASRSEFKPRYRIETPSDKSHPSPALPRFLLRSAHADKVSGLGLSANSLPRST
jgi:hypothetical protein